MTQSDVVRFSSPLVSARVRTATVSWRFFVGRVLALSTTVLCGLLLAAQSAKADTFIFNDLQGNGPGSTDIITVEEINALGVVVPAPNRVLAAGCLGAVGLVELPCLFNISPPSGATNFTGGFAPVGFSGANGTETAIPSDEVSVTNIASVPTPTAQIEVDSCLLEDNSGCFMPITPCSSFSSGVCIPEQGAAPVFVGSLSWNNGAPQDQIFLQSDIDTTTPEPASLILFGSGLAIAGGFLRRRRSGDAFGRCVKA